MSKKIVFALFGILASLAVVVPSFATATPPIYFLLPSLPGVPPAGLLLHNPTEESIAVTLRAFNEKGDLLRQSLVTLDPSQNAALFPGDASEKLPKGVATVQAESDVPIAGFIVLGSLEVPLETLPASGNLAQMHDFIHLSQERPAAYVLFNPNTSLVSVSFHAFDKEGTLLAETAIPPLSPQETRTVPVEELFDSSLLHVIVTVRVVADSPLVGDTVKISIADQEAEWNPLPCLPTVGDTVKKIPIADQEAERDFLNLCPPSVSDAVKIPICDKINTSLTGRFTVTKDKPCVKNGLPCTNPAGCSCIVTAKVGDPNTGCLGKCGRGCDDTATPAGAFVYTQQCFNHDLCRDATGDNCGPCKDEWNGAYDDWMYGYNCTPKRLTATAISPTQIDLTWTENFLNEAGFQIERKTGSSGIWGPIDRVFANEKKFSDKNLRPSTTYYYRIRAFIEIAPSSVGYSGYSPPETGVFATTKPDKTLRGVGLGLAIGEQGGVRDLHGHGGLQ